MIRLSVLLAFPDGEKIIAGEMLCEGRRGAFRYSRAFLDHPNAFPLEPVSFPPRDDPFEYEATDGVAPLFEDSLPDAWGRRLLVRRSNLPRGERTLPRLLAVMGESGLGALSYAMDGDPAEAAAWPGIPDLPRLLDAANRIEEGEAVEDEAMRMLLAAGSSVGGARPKALITDEGVPAIAKFPSKTDTVAMAPLEAATMALARSAGIDTAETRLVRAGRREVLIVRRFDVTGDVPGGSAQGRRHMVSFRTLLGDDGIGRFGYPDLFEAVRRYSFRPETDLTALFRQAVFNAVMGNTDDHLKNFSLLHDDRGFYLSPAYDLLPGVGGDIEHVLSFGTSFVFPGRDGLVKMGRSAGVPSAASVVAQVFESIGAFREKCTECRVPQNQADRFWREISGRILRQ